MNNFVKNNQNFDSSELLFFFFKTKSLLPVHKETQNTQRVKRKHVFLNLCSERGEEEEEKKKEKPQSISLETACVIQLEENMFSVSTMELEPPL